MPKTNIKQKTQNVARIISLVSQLQEKKLLEIAGSDMKVYSALWRDPVMAQNFIKNCYIYMRVKGLISEGRPFNVLDIESGEIIGTYQDGSPEVHISFP